MSGPSLRQLQAHRSIHRGAFGEAKEITEILQKLFSEGQPDKARQAADILMEHWEDRTLSHAQHEEEGFYLEKIQQNPDLQERITKLIRDHDLLRILMTQIKEILAKEGVTKEVIDRFEAMLLVNEIHGRDEETYLFD